MRSWGALLALLVLNACAPRAAAIVHPQVTKRAVNITVLGDSLAYGTGASDSSDGFAFRVYRAIERDRPGSEITNTAIGGSTAADVLRLQVARLRERPADVVLLCVGGNDVVRGVDPRAFERTYADLVRAIRARAPHAALVALGVPDISISPLFAERPGIVRALGAADDRAARAAVRAAGGRYVDLYGFTRAQHDPATFLSADRFHPSDAGHAAIAALVLPTVRAALENK